MVIHCDIPIKSSQRKKTLFCSICLNTGVWSWDNTKGAVWRHSEGLGQRCFGGRKLSHLHLWCHQCWKNLHLFRSFINGFNPKGFYFNCLTPSCVSNLCCADCRSRLWCRDSAQVTGPDLQQYWRSGFYLNNCQTSSLQRICKTLHGATTWRGSIQEKLVQATQRGKRISWLCSTF